MKKNGNLFHTNDQRSILQLFVRWIVEQPHEIMHCKKKLTTVANISEAIASCLKMFKKKRQSEEIKQKERSTTDVLVYYEEIHRKSDPQTALLKFYIGKCGTTSIICNSF